MASDILEHNDEIISVGELNRSAKNLLENNFNNVSVIGEISNLSRPSSGHIYFTLKDEEGAIRCAMFKNRNINLNFRPQNGDQCLLKGQVSIYTARGDYQLIVKNIQPAGSGNLMQKFENLKKKLEAEGLFDSKNKLQVPVSPKHICVVTSSSTAAFQDIISTIKRRAPSSQISISEATVQGDNAHISIINALNRIMKFNENNENEIDVVVLTRGGGSIEDLWCFNNEELAREIHAFPIPTISGVGHEIDFTICDFVSDLRVPTPTASAEVVTEFNFNLLGRLKDLKIDIYKAVLNLTENLNQKIQLLKTKLKDPKALLREKSQKLDNIEILFQKYQQMILSNKTSLINELNSELNLKNPITKLNNMTGKVDAFSEKLNFMLNQKINNKKNDLDKLQKSINILNPLSILDRGYSIILNKKGSAIKSPMEVNKGENLKARLSKGTIDIEVK
ncbi:exodeoxyribonuclease VII large subunit [Gammaproteobacteria bacterium]|nr:exodeoxyribonuclease VII large subunit [Gammaproteobacteria bacterium]